MRLFTTLLALVPLLSPVLIDAKGVMPVRQRSMLRPLPQLPSGMTPQIGLRATAPCLPKPLLLYGEFTSGKAAGIKFADAGRTDGRGAPIAVVNGQPVYRPAPSNAGPAPIAPKLREIHFRYSLVTQRYGETAAARVGNPAGWFAGPLVSANVTIVKDNRDGTADISLPQVDNALFAQAAELVVVTDRCTVAAPMAIRPPTHVGRWYPPAIVESCSGRTGDDSFGKQHPREKIFWSAGPFNQLCLPYGAVHDGGVDPAVRFPKGTDTFLFWEGGFDPAMTIQAKSNCDVVVHREQLPSLTEGELGHPIAARASPRPWRVTVNWSISQPRATCVYAIVLRGRHPTAFPDELRGEAGQTMSIANPDPKGDQMYPSNKVYVGNGEHFSVLHWTYAAPGQSSANYSSPMTF